MSEQQVAVKKRKPFYKKWWFWVLAVIVVVAIANIGGNSQPKSAGSSESTTASNTPQQDEKTEFKVGEVVQLKDNKLTVLSVEKSKGGDFDKPKDGNEFVVIKVRIENAGKDNITYNPFDFKMSNSQGNITDEAFTTIDSNTKLNSGELAPGGKVEGTMTFEQPKGDSKLQLQYKPSFWSNKTISINL